MKEEDAKKKWCPQVRLITVDGNNNVINSTSFNKANKDDGSESFVPNGSKCIGSECMMWESWEYERRNDLQNKTEAINKGEGDCGLKTKELNCNGCNQ